MTMTTSMIMTTSTVLGCIMANNTRMLIRIRTATPIRIHMTTGIRTTTSTAIRTGELWKCHAGCGTGDQITYLEIKLQIPRSEAISMFLDMVGLGNRGGGSFL